VCRSRAYQAGRALAPRFSGNLCTTAAADVDAAGPDIDEGGGGGGERHCAARRVRKYYIRLGDPKTAGGRVWLRYIPKS